MAPNKAESIPRKFVYPSQRPPELDDWVPHQSEGFRERFIKKVKQNPVVPVGCLLTAIALTMGLNQFRKGNMKKSQTMMRFRVGAQAFTIGAILVGVIIQATRKTSSYTPTQPPTLPLPSQK